MNTILHSHLGRRLFLKTALVGSMIAAGEITGLSRLAFAAAPYTLPPLPYPENALEPYISRRTLEFHHGKHHRAYVEKTNELLQGTGLEGLSQEDVIRRAADVRNQALFNSAAQDWNHSFYWKCMKPNGGGEPGAELAKALTAGFGSVGAFKERFSGAAETQFGSGWAWLALDGGSLKVLNTGNADTPIVHGMKPLLTIDVWEHAYYLDYQNRRKEYIQAFLDHLVNWEFVSSNLAKA